MITVSEIQTTAPANFKTELQEKDHFLCNRQQTEFYLFITCGDKPFRSKDFSAALEVARVSFAPAERMER